MTATITKTRKSREQATADVRNVQGETTAKDRALLDTPYAVDYARFLLGEVTKQPTPAKYRITKAKAKSLRNLVRTVTPDSRPDAPVTEAKTAKPKATNPTTPARAKLREAVATKTTPEAKPSIFVDGDVQMLAEGVALVIEECERQVAAAQAKLDQARALAVKVVGS